MIVAKFLSWVETAPVERRAEATSALARAYLHSPLDRDEKEAAETALTILLDDPAPMVRTALAHALAASPYSPRQVILSLIEDIDAVACPVIAASPVLLDSELVDLVAERSLAIQKAIASRPSISPSLAAALSEVAGAEACQVMLNNPGAKVAVFSLRRIAERFGALPDMRNMLLALPGLPVAIRQMLIVQLGDALQQMAVVKSFMSSDKRQALVQDACDNATVHLAFSCEQGRELTALVEHLRLSGQLTADILIRGLCMGNVGLFVAAMTSLTGVSEDRIMACVRDPNEGLVLALCEKAGLPEAVVPAIHSALLAHGALIGKMEASASRSRFARRMVDAILSDYSHITDDEMDDLHARLRRFATQIARDEARDMRLKIQKANAA